MRRLSSFPALVLVGAVLAGCSGGSGGSGDSGDPSDAAASATSESGSESGSPSAAESTATASPTPYRPVPAGITLTPQGTELRVGETAVVAYQAPRNVTGVLEITVERLERTTFKESFVGWKLDKQVKGTSPYFVHATVRNVGESDLGGQRVPLYIVDGRDTLVEYSRFASRFRPCPSTDFPAVFRPDRTLDACLVYLAPDRGDLTAVSFRPTQEFNPITWTGKLQAVGGADDRRGAKDEGKRKRKGGSRGPG